VLVLPLLPPVAALLAAGSVVAVGDAIVVAVKVAGALALKPLQGGLDLLPVAAAARLAAAWLGAQQLRDCCRAALRNGRPFGAVGPLTRGAPPARPAPPGLVPHLELAAGGGVLGSSPARPAGRGRCSLSSRPGALAPPCFANGWSSRP